MKKWNIVITVLLFILGVLCFIFFEVRPITVIKDDVLANKLLCGFISRASLCLMFGWLLYQYGGYRFMGFNRRFPRALLWALPCFMVAIINFPFSALIKGEATITRTDLIPLYAVYILSIAILEELIFRGTLLIVLSDLFRNSRHRPLFVVLFGALIFSLFHLTNLLTGAGIQSVLLQCLYTFLIGAMLAVTMLRCKNIWLCALIHFIFDFGGLLIIQIGAGNPWDIVFWILTIVGGVLCAGHIIFTLVKLEKEYVS